MGLFKDMLEIVKIGKEATTKIKSLKVENAETDEEKFNLFKEYLDWLFDRVEKSSMSNEMKDSFLEGAIGKIWKDLEFTNISKDKFLDIFGKKWEKYLR